MDFQRQIEDSSFSISAELLVLMAHIVDEHPHDLQELVHKAQQTLATKKNVPHDPDIHENIIDFLSLMEIFVQQSYHDVEVDTMLTKQIMPAIDHIDQNNCDQEAVNASIERATYQKAKNPKINAQEFLYKELLKRYKPSKKTSIH